METSYLNTFDAKTGLGKVVAEFLGREPCMGLTTFTEHVNETNR